MQGYGTRKNVAEKVDHINPIKKMYSSWHFQLYFHTFIYDRGIFFFIFFFFWKHNTWQANSSSPLYYYKVKLSPLISQTKGNTYYSLFSQCFYRNTGIRTELPKSKL